MSKGSNRLIAVILISLLFFSCGTSKKLKQEKKLAAKTAEIGNVINANQLNYNWFSARIKADAGEEGNMMGVTVSVRLKKDSAIWMSFSKFGIEGARALITPDSLKLINKLGKEYLVKPYSYLDEMLGNSVEFTTLQDLIVGKMVYFNTENLKIFENKENYISLESTTEKYINRITVGITNYLPTKSELNERFGERYVKQEFFDYKEVNNVQLSHKRKIKLKGEALYYMDASFSRIKLEGPFQMPFVVNPNYKVVK